MADYLIHDSTLEDIADAIRSKTGGSSLIAPEDMPSEIASISGGGGGTLPSIISKIDGGSFTVSSDTSATNYSISHTLGVIPKVWIIWLEDGISETNSTRYIHSVGLSACDVTEKNNSNFVYNAWYAMLYAGNRSGQVIGILSSQAPNFVTTTTITYYNSNLYYKAGLTYKWLAWA